MEELKADTLFHLKMIDLFRHYYFRHAFCDTGIYRGQYPILTYLQNHDGCTQIEIANELNLSPVAITKTLTRLEKAKLIKKEQDKKNRRANLIFLTEKGKEALINSRERFSQIDDLTFKDFTENEIMELKGLIDRMLINLSNEKDLNNKKLKALIDKLEEEKK